MDNEQKQAKSSKITISKLRLNNLQNVKKSLARLANEMLKGNEQKIIGVDDLPIVYAKAIPVSYPHYELFRIFFDDLTRKSIVSKNTLTDTIKAIEFGV